MAKVTYSGLVTQIQGSIGGTTFQRSRAGGIIKNKPIRKHSVTSAMQAQQQRILLAVRSWRSLSAANRLAWTTMAGIYTNAESGGVPYTPTGYQLYLNQYLLSLSCGQTPLVTPVAPSVQSVVNQFINFTRAVGNLSFEVANAATQACFIIVYATPCVSYGIKSPPNYWRLIYTTPWPHTAETYGIVTQYQAIFGTMVVGRQLWLKIRTVDSNSRKTAPDYITPLL